MEVLFGPEDPLLHYPSVALFWRSCTKPPRTHVHAHTACATIIVFLVEVSLESIEFSKEGKSLYV